MADGAAGVAGYRNVGKKKLRFAFAITLHRIEGLAEATSGLRLQWKRGNHDGQTKEVEAQDGVAKFEETISMGVALFRNVKHNRFEKKSIKLCLDSNGEKVGELDLDLATYASQNSTESKSLPFPLSQGAGGTLHITIASKAAKQEDEVSALPPRLSLADTADMDPLDKLQAEFLCDRVDDLEDEHPEWTTISSAIHPELYATITAEIKACLEAVVIREQPSKPLGSMEKAELEEHFAPIISLLSSPDMMLTSACCSVTGLNQKECEEAAGALVGFYDDREEGQRLLRAIIMHEVLTHGPSPDLFAESTAEEESRMTAVILAFFLEELASDFLTSTLQTGLDLAVSLDGSLGVEAAKTNDEATSVLANLTHVCSEIVNSLCQSTGDIPVILSYISFLLQQSLMQYPEYQKKVIGGFLIRRVIGPALLQPEDYLLEEDAEPLSKQVMNVFKIATRALESMADGEQLRTKEAWVPEVNSIIRQHMHHFNIYVEDLVTCQDGYYTKIEPMGDFTIDFGTSLFFIQQLVEGNMDQIAERMAMLVIQKAFLMEESELQVWDGDEYEDNRSVFSMAGGGASLTMENMMPGSGIVLTKQEEDMLNSTIQAAQVYKKQMQAIMKQIGEWRIKDLGGRPLYAQVEDEIVVSQEYNRGVLEKLGRLRIYLQEGEGESDGSNSGTGITDRRGGSLPGTPICNSPLTSPNAWNRTPLPPTPVGGGRNSRASTPVRATTPLGMAPPGTAGRRSRPPTPVDNMAGTPIQVIEAASDERGRLNELIAVVNSVAELYDIMRFSRMDTLLDADPSMSAETASEQSNTRLEHVIAQSKLLSSFQISSPDVIVVGNSLLEIVGDTAEVMQQVNNMRAALEVKRSEETMAEGNSTASPPPGEKKSPRGAGTGIRRLSTGVANFMKTLSGEESDAKEAPMPLYQDPLSVKDDAPKDGSVEKTLNFLRDAHTLWRRLTASSFETLTKRDSLRKAPLQSILEVSTAEIKFVKKDISELKQQWDGKCAAAGGLPAVGKHLVLELLAENSVLRLDLNMQQEELHRAALQRLKTLEQYTTTVTRDSASAGDDAEDSPSQGPDMTDRFKNLFSF